MIIQKPTPNFTVGRGGQKPEAVVIHIMAGTLSGTDSWFANPVSSVSAHYGIGKNGEIHQYVKEEDTAWHAGKTVNPTWPLLHGNPNPYTIGIEHEGASLNEWNDTQLAVSAVLVKDICTRWNIPIDRLHIIGHYEIRSDKTCPATDRSVIDKIIRLAKPQENMFLIKLKAARDNLTDAIKEYEDMQ